jgi:hypothetical protein
MMLPILDVDTAADNLDKLDQLSAHMGGGSHIGDVLGALVGLAAVLLIFGSPVMIVVSVLRHRLNKQRLVNDLALRLAEKGQAVPPELFTDTVPVKSDLRRGIIWASVGLGVAVFGAFDGDNDVIGIGFIPVMIGIGYAIAAWLENRQRRVM